MVEITHFLHLGQSFLWWKFKTIFSLLYVSIHFVWNGCPQGCKTIVGIFDRLFIHILHVFNSQGAFSAFWAAKFNAILFPDFKFTKFWTLFENRARCTVFPKVIKPPKISSPKVLSNRSFNLSFQIVLSNRSFKSFSQIVLSNRSFKSFFQIVLSLHTFHESFNLIVGGFFMFGPTVQLCVALSSADFSRQIV